MNQLSDKSERRITGLLVLSVVMNLIIFVLLAWDILPISRFTLRFAGGFFLLVFVSLHGWYRYGRNNMVIFFAITLAITWTAETLSIETGIPFGKFNYTDSLGEKIGNVPILIIPAYYYNGYLAWIMANLFVGSREAGVNKQNVIRVPLISTIIMVIWNLTFDPIMSTIEGNWIWHDGGIYFGVPLSNFLGWFITVFLVFQLFSLFLFRSGNPDGYLIKSSHWYLFPIMYIVQGIPSLLYPFFRDDNIEIYRSIALITVLTMFIAAVSNIFVIRHHNVLEEET